MQIMQILGTEVKVDVDDRGANKKSAETDDIFSLATSTSIEESASTEVLPYIISDSESQINFDKKKDISNFTLTSEDKPGSIPKAKTDLLSYSSPKDVIGKKVTSIESSVRTMSEPNVFGNPSNTEAKGLAVTTAAVVIEETANREAKSAIAVAQTSNSAAEPDQAVNALIKADHPIQLGSKKEPPGFDAFSDTADRNTKYIVNEASKAKTVQQISQPTKGQTPVVELSERIPGPANLTSRAAEQKLTLPRETDGSRITKDVNVTVMTSVAQTEEVSGKATKEADIVRSNPLDKISEKPNVTQSEPDLPAEKPVRQTQVEALYRSGVSARQQADLKGNIPQQDDPVQVVTRTDAPKVTLAPPEQAPIQPPATPPRASKTSPSIRTMAKQNDAPAQKMEKGPQVKQAPQASTPQSVLPITSSIPPIAEGFHSHEGPQTRDSGPQISMDVQELRRDIASTQKVETIGRPVVHQLTQAARAAVDGSVEVRLAPEELGRVRMSLNPGEANITVHIIAERQETMDLIRRNLELFSQSLKQEGFTNLTFSFGGSGGDQSSGQDEAHVIDHPQATKNTDDVSAQQAPARLRTSGNLDIRI